MESAQGRSFEAMDPLEWLARLADHIPDAGRQRTRFYVFYASRVRAARNRKQGISPRRSAGDCEDGRGAGARSRARVRRPAGGVEAEVGTFTTTISGRGNRSLAGVSFNAEF
jgi:hypothetical protein